MKIYIKSDSVGNSIKSLPKAYSKLPEDKAYEIHDVIETIRKIIYRYHKDLGGLIWRVNVEGGKTFAKINFYRSGAIEYLLQNDLVDSILDEVSSLTEYPRNLIEYTSVEGEFRSYGWLKIKVNVNKV